MWVDDPSSSVCPWVGIWAISTFGDTARASASADACLCVTRGDGIACRLCSTRQGTAGLLCSVCGLPFLPVHPTPPAVTPWVSAVPVGVPWPLWVGLYVPDGRRYATAFCVLNAHFVQTSPVFVSLGQPPPCSPTGKTVESGRVARGMGGAGTGPGPLSLVVVARTPAWTPGPASVRRLSALPSCGLRALIPQPASSLHDLV